MQTAVKSERYMWVVIACGALCAGAAAVGIVRSEPDIYIVLLGVLTVAVGSRTIIQIPRFRSHISVSDTFIFLTLLLYGGPCAVLLATIEAGVSAWRFCNRKLTIFFNAALLALSTTVVVLVLEALGLYTDGQLHGRGDDRQGFLILISVVALTQFLVNTSLASLYDKLKSG